jgi:hypothetical protein
MVLVWIINSRFWVADAAFRGSVYTGNIYNRNDGIQVIHCIIAYYSIGDYGTFTNRHGWKLTSGNE